MNYLPTYHFDKNKKIRYGQNTDGGYVIAILDNDNYDCYISAGISNEESFSRDFISKYGLTKENSFGFDGTIYDYPYHYTRDITFIKKNISDLNDNNHTNLHNLLAKYKDIFIKMDIEGGEYNWLKSLDTKQLSNIKQLVIEFHGINDDSWGAKKSDKISYLEKLSQTHYIIHAHGNNNSGINCNGIPDVIELTYIRKTELKDIPSFNSYSLPIPNLDYPNWYLKTDYDISVYPFVIGHKQTVTNIYENKYWGDDHHSEYSGSSGVGNKLENNKEYIAFLKDFIIENKITSVCDLGCGNFYDSMCYLYYHLKIDYTGYDAYDKIITYNKNMNRQNNYKFELLDFFREKENIKSADLCILKDVLQQWTNLEIETFLDYLIDSKKFKYILICNCSNQTSDERYLQYRSRWSPLSHKFLPLKKYNPDKIFNYNTKEVCLIKS